LTPNRMSRTQHKQVASTLDNAIANLEFVMRILAGSYGNGNWHLSQAVQQADNGLRNLRVQLMLLHQDEYPNENHDGPAFRTSTDASDPPDVLYGSQSGVLAISSVNLVEDGEVPAETISELLVLLAQLAPLLRLLDDIAEADDWLNVSNRWARRDIARTHVLDNLIGDKWPQIVNLAESLATTWAQIDNAVDKEVAN
jgi:hypothetical protein